MSFLDFASRMFPYWCMGAFMFWAVWNSKYKDLLSFDKKSCAKFFLTMVCVTFIRVWLIKLAISQGANTNGLKAIHGLPIGGTLFVGWEDLCFSVPLVLLRRILGTSKWMMPIHYLVMAFTAFSFFTGHIYQGYTAAAFISLYIPFGVYFGQKKGFATLMANHVIYDFCTFLAIIIAIG
jgi:hypothetical protein